MISEIWRGFIDSLDFPIDWYLVGNELGLYILGGIIFYVVVLLGILSLAKISNGVV